MTKKKTIVPIRAGMPAACIVCGGALHAKSEHYCSVTCERLYRTSGNDDAPQFLSKWKIRKRKKLADPLVGIRQKTRSISKALLKSGKIKRRPCLVCGSRDAVMHHEDYDKPRYVLWLCDEHHKAYHDGKIGLLGNTLWWDSSRLIPHSYRGLLDSMKYAEIERNLLRKNGESKR